MYGWRTRLGVIVPAANTVVENEFPRLVPEGVSVHIARLPRLPIADVSERLVAEAESADLEKCAETLAAAGVKVIVYACTSGSFLGGPDYPRRIESRIRDATGIPAVATARAVIQSMLDLGWHDIGIVTPYPPRVHKATAAFAEASGFNVRILVGLDVLPGYSQRAIGDLEPHIAYFLGCQALRGSSNLDGLFISCTAFRSLEAIAWLQEDFGVHVISSNLVSVRTALKEVGFNSSTLASPLRGTHERSRFVLEMTSGGGE